MFCIDQPTADAIRRRSWATGEQRKRLGTIVSVPIRRHCRIPTGCATT